MKKEVRQKECEVALKDLQKKIQLKKTKFISGQNGLQACQVAAVEMYLQFVVANGQLSQDASGHAAESWGFAPKWGRRQVHMWTRLWIRMREFPQSLIGQHAKIYLLLSNPEIAAELRAYICSNMWVMDPEKLSKFLKDQLVPKAAEEYLCLITKEEMPWGLKKYMELKLFPHIHLRVGCSISLATAWRWLHSEGFRYTTHKKGLYFDGHDHADVVEYHQKVSCLQWKLTSHGWSNMWWEMSTKSLSYHSIILLSTALFSYHKMRWHHKPMTSWRRCGFIRTSIVCTRRGLVAGFTKVIPFVQQLGGWRKGCKPLNMARTTMVIGMGSYLWNRSDLSSIVCHHYWWIFE